MNRNLTWLRSGLPSIILLTVLGCSSSVSSPAPAPTSPAAPGGSPGASVVSASPAAAPSVASAAVSSPSSAASAVPLASPGSALVPTPSPAAGPLTTLQFSYVNSTPANMWWQVAESQGIFAANGLQVNKTQIGNPDAGPAALVSGQIDIAEDGGPSALTAAAGGADIVMTAVTTPIWDFVLMAPDSIQSIDDLKGKVVGYASPGSPSDLSTRQALQKHGIDPDTDVTMFNVGAPANRAPALLGGSVQAVTVTPPDDLALEAQGFHIIDNIAQDNLPGAVAGQMTTRAYMNAHRDVVQKLIDAQVQTVALLHNNPAFALAQMHQFFQYDDPNAYTTAYDFFYGDPNVTPTLPYPRADQFTATQQALAEQNPAVGQYDINNLLDAEFVQSAADRGLQNYNGS